MKATGIVRRVDDLGRVVIPKEIRRTMGIKEGDPLEIYTDRTSDGLPMIGFVRYSTTLRDNFNTLTSQVANEMSMRGEYELSDEFCRVIEEAAKILKEFENRG